jgi:hypothetical protein
MNNEDLLLIQVEVTRRLILGELLEQLLDQFRQFFFNVFPGKKIFLKVRRD